MYQRLLQLEPACSVGPFHTSVVLPVRNGSLVCPAAFVDFTSAFVNACPVCSRHEGGDASPTELLGFLRRELKGGHERLLNESIPPPPYLAGVALLKFMQEVLCVELERGL